MTKTKYCVRYIVLFLVFALADTVYFGIYRSAFILRDGVVSDYYIAAFLGLMYSRITLIAPDFVYNAVILCLVLVSGLSLMALLKSIKMDTACITAVDFFYMFSGFTVIVGYSHPDLILLMIFLPLCIMFIKSKKYIYAVVFILISALLIFNILRGDALKCLFRWIGGMDSKALFYFAVPVMLFVTLLIMKKHGFIEDKCFYTLLMFVMLYANLITCFFEFSIFEKDAVNSLYVSKENMYGSLTSLADILFKGGAK